MSLVQNSVATATWAGYGKAWREWCDCVDLERVDVSVEDRWKVVYRYVSMLRDSGVSAAVASRRISGLNFHFQLRGWGNLFQSFVLRQALKGWRREVVCKDSRRPVSYALLCRLVSALPSICSSSYESLVFGACFSLAFFGALRLGELVPSSRSRPGGLLFEDVLLCNDSLRIRIRRSKTDSLGKGAWIPLQRVDGDVCPVRSVSDYLSRRAQGSSFLVHESGFPVTSFQFRSVFNKSLSFLGADPSEYGTHSFRIGAATEASRAGLSVESVQRIGRWRSSCYAGYVRPELPHICFLGHSYVFWAAQRAEVRPGGKSLGFREMDVEWRGIRGLKWCQVLPEAISIGQVAPPPVILVIHAGGNDLCVMRVAELITLMRADMERIASYFSEVILVWSEMISRVTWQGARDAAAVEKARRTVNARLSRFVRSKGWVVVRHRQLEGDNRRLMRSDGVHLNDIGLDIFLSGLQDGVEQALFLLGGGRSPV
ncbi:uncharacterized protein RB166_008366 [Leptodactylus fuscus]